MPTSEVQQAWANLDAWTLTKYYFDINLSPLQVELVKKIAFHEELDIWRLCVSAMTRWGKSFCVSIGIALHYIKCRKKKTFFIGPYSDQARILRDYMTERVFECPILLADSDIELKGKETARKEASKNRMTFTATGNEYRVFSAEGDGNRLMGHGLGSGGGILVKDEAVLINDVANARIGRMAGDNPDRVLIIEAFNPWNRDNRVSDHVDDPNWEYIHIGWEDAIKDGRTTKEFVDEQRRELTPLEFQVLYDSNFPDESEDQLIPYWAIEAATYKKDKDGKKVPREIPNLPHTDDMRMGVDVAEMGIDLTVMIIGGKYKGLYVPDEIRADPKQEVMVTVGIIKKIENERQDAIPLKHLTIDSSGMGTGVAGRLEELRRENKIGARTKRFVSAKKPRGKKEQERFLNLKAQAYFHLRELFVNKQIILHHELVKEFPQLVKQLGQMKWQLQSNSKIRILDPGEAKDDTSKKKSPDFADALCYFCWDEDQGGHVRFLGKRKENDEQGKKLKKLHDSEQKE